MELAIAGGGTGGHLYPGLAVAAAVREIDPKDGITFYGTKYGIESRVLPETDYAVRYVSAKGFLGKRKSAQLLSPAYLAGGVVQSFFYMSKKRPDVILGTGGYVSAPPVIAAWLLGIPVALLALDVMPSKTVRLLSRFADVIYSGFPECAEYLSKKSTVIFTGNPIRAEIGGIPRDKGIEKFGLKGNRETILVFGGSQGAHSINRAVLGSLEYLKKSGRLDGIQIIFQTGKNDYEMVLKATGEYLPDVKVLAYIDDMPLALAAADLVISRSGSAVSETLACGLPSILIPYPYAASNHQEYNARSLEKAGAAEVIMDRDLNGQILSEKISAILFDEKKYRQLSDSSKSLARRNAARDIAQKLIYISDKKCSEK
jgi:UDP-N-acetylglucosamine--N-acetylmuramyl-(pentapeptide) pyrophosphoryl-undecaprenol N-acetylglucosamine transferase